MASSAAPPTLNPTSPFIEYCTLTTRGLLVSLLRLVAHNYRLTATEAACAYLDGTNIREKTVGFKQLLNDYFQGCCKEYMITHQQIVSRTKQISNLDKNNLDEFVYCTMQKIMSQTNGFKHLNCIFDGAMMVCVLQFTYVLTSLRNGLEMSCSNPSRNGLFHDSEATLLRFVFEQELRKANDKLDELRANDDRYRNVRLSCDKSNTCELDFRNEHQRQKQLLEEINQSIHVSQSPPPREHQ